MFLDSNFFNSQVKQEPPITALYLLDDAQNIITFGKGSSDGNMIKALQNFSGTLATTRVIYGEAAVTGSITSITGSLCAVRGELNVGTGLNIAGGYFYGTQGKAILDGATVAIGANDHLAGVYAQMSANGSTFTSGHIAILICSGQNLPASSNADAIYVESGAGPINSCLKTVLNANVVFDLSEQNVTNTMCKATSVTNGLTSGTYGWIAVKVQGQTRYIPLINTVS